MFVFWVNLCYALNIILGRGAAKRKEELKKFVRFFHKGRDFVII